MKSSPLLIAALCATGLITGAAARRFSPTTATAPVDTAEPSRGPATSENPTRSGGHASTRTARSAAAPMLPHLRSTDSLADLLALKDDELYTRLAAWLTDASEPDIAAFWKSYGPRNGRSNDITDLVFLNWARLDPRAAIAGSSSDQHAWWAWACHDPAGALAEALAHAPDHSHHVAWGIGEFHPEWLRAHYHELGEKDQSHALQGMEKWSDGQDPLAAMAFMQEIGHRVDKGTFQALIRKDPWAALDWLKENPGRNGDGRLDYSVGDPMQLVIDTMARERPEDLVRLAQQTPSGAAKLKIESAIFTNLLQTDPQAALAQAQQSKIPRIAAERLAAVGMESVKTNPDQAYARAKELFAACPTALNMYSMIEYPGGSSGSGVTIPGVQEFLGSLMAKDPARTLDLTVGSLSSDPGGGGFGPLAEQWIRRDLPAYTEWLARQSKPETRQQGGNLAVGHLIQTGDFFGAAEMSAGMEGTVADFDPLSATLYNWTRNDPNAAAGWLEAADLPAARKASIQKIMEQNQPSYFPRDPAGKEATQKLLEQNR